MHRRPWSPSRRPAATTRLVSIAVLLLALALPPLAAAGKAATKRSRDTTPPTLSVASPVSGAVLSGTIVASGSASDNVQVAKVEISVDGGSYALAAGTTSWSGSVNTAAYSTGSHTLNVRATDSSGNSTVVSVAVSFADQTPPAVAISSPGAGATLAGTASISGTASDNAQLAKVEVSVDGGVYATAQGTASWSYALDTTSLANGPHTITARATDSSGNTTSAAVAVNVANDTTPPTVAIASPGTGATVSGSVSVAGTASDDVQLAKVEVSVDGGVYTAAQGTASWSYSLDTTTLGNGSHTITARATDTSGNVATASETVDVENPLPPGVVQQLVTPEGATIQIYSDAVGWTAQQVYDLLKPNAYQLSLIGPMLTIDVTAQYASQTTTSASSSNGVWGNYKATITLQANGTSAFATRPDAVVAHEYGHAWTNYYYYVKWQRDWTSYLVERGIYGNPLVDSSYQWSTREMIADDYRLLFGTSTAQSEMAYINPDVPDPRTVSGLKDWFVNTWGS